MSGNLTQPGLEEILKQLSLHLLPQTLRNFSPLFSKRNLFQVPMSDFSPQLTAWKDAGLRHYGPRKLGRWETWVLT